MPGSVIAHMATGFIQILYSPIFDMIITIYENDVWDLCVCLTLKQFTHFYFIFCSFTLRKLVTYQSFRFPGNLLLKVIYQNYTFTQKTLQKDFFLSLVNNEVRYCIGLDIMTKNSPTFFLLQIKSNELILRTKLISFIPIPYYTFNTNFFITTTPCYSIWEGVETWVHNSLR